MPSKASEENRALLGACSVIRGLLAGVERDEILTRHRVGVALLAIKQRRDTYGTQAVERVAEELGVGTRLLYQHITVAEHWTEVEIRVQVDKTNRFGQPLSWSHLLALTRIDDANARIALVDDCLGNAWSVHELTQQVEQHVASAMAQQDNRPRSSDAARAGEAVRAALKEGIHSGGRAVSDVRLFEEALGERLADADEPVDDELLGRALRTFEELQARAESAIARLREARMTASQRRVRVARTTGPMIAVPREAATDEERDPADTGPGTVRRLGQRSKGGT